MENIKTGIVKPREADRGTVVGKVIEYGITTPSSDHDHRPDVGSAGYIGASQLEKRSSSLKAGNTQKKKHRSTGKGQ